MTKRLIILISGSGSNLLSIIRSIELNQQGAEISHVISNRKQALGLQHASSNNIPCTVLESQAFDNRQAYDHALMQIIAPFRPSLVVLAGFMRILSKTFVEAFHGQLINIHPSLLPKYQGLNTHQRVLQAGDKVHGSSVHYVTELLDQGPVIAQTRLKVKATDTVQSLCERVKLQEHLLYPQVVNWCLAGRLKLHQSIIYFDGQPLPHPIIQADGYYEATEI